MYATLGEAKQLEASSEETLVSTIIDIEIYYLVNKIIKKNISNYRNMY